MIGEKRYSLPECFLLKYPQFPPLPPFSSSITLHDVHEDAGHSLVHFLYTGNYETIKLPLKKGISVIAREYRISVFVHEVSKKYGLVGLEALTQHYIQRFGDKLSLSDILRETRDIFSKLPEDETWFPNFIKGELQRMLKPSEVAYTLDELYKVLGQNDRFDNMVLKMVLEILSVHLRSQSRDEEVHAEDVVYQNESVVEDTDIDDEAPAEEVAYEEQVPAEEVVYEDEAPAIELAYETEGLTEQAAHEVESPADEAVREEETPAIEQATADRKSVV